MNSDMAAIVGIGRGERIGKRVLGRTRRSLTSGQIVILTGQMVTALHAQVEARARAMLRETIERSGWYPAVSGKERQQLIERNVERHWPLMVSKVTEGLEQRRDCL